MKIGKVLQIFLLSVLAFGFRSSGHAQENLVNLYNWTIVTNWPPTNYITVSPEVSITSSNSMNLLAGLEWDPWEAPPFPPTSLLTTEIGNLNTTPGATYKISLTVYNEDANSLLGGRVTFGNYTLWLLVLEDQGLLNPPPTNPTNIIFTSVATSNTTTMSILAGIGDPQNIAIVSGLTVIALPGITGITANHNGSIRLNLIGTPGDNYVLESATNLIPPVNWVTLSTNSPGRNGVWQFTDLQATNFPQQFYRLESAQ